MQPSLEMLKTHPRKPEVHMDLIGNCIQQTFDCSQACLDCADACLGEQDVQNLIRCIRLNQDCADVCKATGQIVSRQTEPSVDILRAQLGSCITACRECAAECDKHAAMYEHCRICAQACRSCEQACDSLLSTIEMKPSGASPFLSTC